MNNKEVDSYIINNFMTMSNDELATVTNKTKNSIQARLTKLKLSRKVKFVLAKNERLSNVYINDIDTGYKISSNGRVMHPDGYIIAIRLNTYGYPVFNIKLDGKIYTPFVHVLVATAFVKNPDPIRKIQVNHDDGIKTNNYYKNLEWMTRKENIDHAYATGLMDAKTNENSNFSKYTNIEIEFALKCLKENQGLSAPDIKDKFSLKMSANYLNSLRSGKRRKHPQSEKALQGQ